MGGVQKADILNHAVDPCSGDTVNANGKIGSFIKRNTQGELAPSCVVDLILTRRSENPNK